MSLEQARLPQLNGSVFLCDGGLETTLVFLEGIDLPCFAAFPLLERDEGRDALRRYFHPYLETAAANRTGFILDTVTWRANPDWGERLGYTGSDLDRINRNAVAFASEQKTACVGVDPIVINGVLGPRGDGYQAGIRMSAEEAEDYHRPQVQAFAAGGVDMVSAITMTYPEEATGIARAAKAAGLPVALSFTVETDGRLPSGDSVRSAIEAVDAATDRAAAYYMINCAHPLHIEHVLAEAGPWRDRIRGLRANASTLSHAELDAATELDSGNPADLSRLYRDLRRHHKGLTVLGGCCGTDHRHIAAICEACFNPAQL
jgi:S-methylmethionine-dependent homocysteine/selenocysteine methylase